MLFKKNRTSYINYLYNILPKQLWFYIEKGELKLTSVWLRLYGKYINRSLTYTLEIEVEVKIKDENIVSKLKKYYEESILNLIGKNKHLDVLVNNAN